MPPEISRNSPTKAMRRLFFSSLVGQLRVVWPIFSGMLLSMMLVGVLIGQIEDWRLDEALYFTFVTALTIGYGDFAPHFLVSRALAVLLGFAGIVLTGLVAAVAVQALRAVDDLTA